MSAAENVRDMPPPPRSKTNGKAANGNARPTRKPTHEALLDLLNEPPIERLPTGHPTLDEITRGGLPFGKVVIIGGGPNAGKTTEGVQLVYTAARAGCATMVVAADIDDRESMAQRLAQQAGLCLEDLESRIPEAVRKMAEIVQELGVDIVDQDEDALFLEDAIDELAKRPGPRVLLVDSAQKARCRDHEGLDNELERMKVTCRVLKAGAKKHNILVIATSELNRGAYRNRKAEENYADIAAFKHSGDIEHLAWIALVLRSVPGEDGLVDVGVAKNKRGKDTRPFRLKHDHRRCRFEETDMPENEAETPAMEQVAHRIRAAVRDNPGIGSKALRSLVKGGRETYEGALEWLIDRGEIADLVTKHGRQEHHSYRLKVQP